VDFSNGADLVVGVVEGVVDVPPQLKEFLPLETNRVEEAEAEQQLLELFPLATPAAETGA
jgi:hypothetical protein